MLKTGSPDNIINPPCLPVSQLETVISETAGLNGKREGLADVFAPLCVRVVRVVQMLRGEIGEGGVMGRCHLQTTCCAEPSAVDLPAL